MSRESRRLQLQSALESILGSDCVYFQPPASISMEYPCIVYSLADEYTLHANDAEYLTRDKYTITLITKDPLPDSIMTEISDMPYTRFDRHYVGDNLHHFSYTIESFERYSHV